MKFIRHKSELGCNICKLFLNQINQWILSPGWVKQQQAQECHKRLPSNKFLSYGTPLMSFQFHLTKLGGQNSSLWLFSVYAVIVLSAITITFHALRKDAHHCIKEIEVLCKIYPIKSNEFCYLSWVCHIYCYSKYVFQFFQTIRINFDEKYWFSITCFWSSTHCLVK